MPTFNQAVQRTWRVRDLPRRTTWLSMAMAFLATLGFRTADSPYLAYAFLFAGLFILYHELGHTGQAPREHPSLTLRSIFKPIALGVPLVVFLFILVVLFRNPGYAPGSAWDKLRQALLLVLIAPLVEEFAFRWVFLLALPWSPLSSAVLFSVAHPAVVAYILQGQWPPWWLLGAYFLFALAMTGVVLLYEVKLPRKANLCFGIVLAIVLHGGLNAATLIWS